MSRASMLVLNSSSSSSQLNDNFMLVIDDALVNEIVNINNFVNVIKRINAMSQQISPILGGVRRIEVALFEGRR